MPGKKEVSRCMAWPVESLVRPDACGYGRAGRWSVYRGLEFQTWIWQRCSSVFGRFDKVVLRAWSIERCSFLHLWARCQWAYAHHKREFPTSEPPLTVWLEFPKKLVFMQWRLSYGFEKVQHRAVLLAVSSVQIGAAVDFLKILQMKRFNLIGNT